MARNKKQIRPGSPSYPNVAPNPENTGMGEIFFHQVSRIILSPFHFLLPSTRELQIAQKGGILGFIWLIIRYMLKICAVAIVIYSVVLLTLSVLKNRPFDYFKQVKDAVTGNDPDHAKKIEDDQFPLDPITKHLKSPLYSSLILFALYLLFLFLFYKTMGFVFGLLCLASLAGIFYLASIFGSSSSAGILIYVLSGLAVAMLLVVIFKFLQGMFKKKPIC